MSFRFKGWVPTVTGRLSFSIIGSEEELYSCNIPAGNSRFIVSASKRSLSDSVLPDFIIRYFFKNKVDFWFLCIASSGDNPVDADDALKGMVYIFDDAGLWRNVKSFIEKQTSLFKNAITDQEIEELYSNLESASAKELSCKSLFLCDFVLQRNGVIEIKVPDNLGSIISPGAPPLPENDKLEMIHSRCSQIFFFLKDMTHIHQHHSPTMDTLVGLYHVEDDDYTWRCETLRVLQRKVLEYKRAISRDSNGVVNNIRNSSLGILSYIKSFRKICEYNKGKKLQPEWNIDYLESSILAAQESQRNILQVKIRAADLSRNIFIGLFGIIFSFVGLGSLMGTFTKDDTFKKIKPHDFYTETISFILQNPIWVLITILFMVFLIFTQVNIVNIKNHAWYRNLVRISLLFKQKRAGFFVLFVSLLNILTIYFLLYLYNTNR